MIRFANKRANFAYHLNPLKFYFYCRINKNPKKTEFIWYFSSRRKPINKTNIFVVWSVIFLGLAVVRDADTKNNIRKTIYKFWQQCSSSYKNINLSGRNDLSFDIFNLYWFFWIHKGGLQQTIARMRFNFVFLKYVLYVGYEAKWCGVQIEWSKGICNDKNSSLASPKTLKSKNTPHNLKINHALTLIFITGIGG